MEPLLVAVVGPTGSGKTAQSLALAERFGGEIVNCDSVAIYREFHIGSAKAAVEGRRRAGAGLGGDRRGPRPPPLQQRGAEWLHRILTRLDRAAAANIHANDTPKVIRAIEVCLAPRQRMSELR